MTPAKDGEAIVYVTAQMFEQWFAFGTAFGFECIHGLPPGSKLVDVSFSPYRRGVANAGCVRLKFAHPLLAGGIREIRFKSMEVREYEQQ